MKTILDIVNASTGRNSATDDKFPRRIMHGQLRCRLHGQAAAQGHPPLSGQRPGGWYHGRDRQRGGRRVGADGRGHAWLRHHRDVSLHAEGSETEARVMSTLGVERPAGHLGGEPVPLSAAATGMGACKRKNKSRQRHCRQVPGAARQARRGDRAVDRAGPLRRLAPACSGPPRWPSDAAQARPAHVPGHVRPGDRHPGPALQRASSCIATRCRSAPPTSGARCAIARALSADIDREITAIITTLEALATSPALATRDFMAFHVQALEALRSRPSWNVVLDRQPRASSRSTRACRWERACQSAAGRATCTDIVLQTGQPYISDLFRGTVARRLIFAVGVPVHVGDGIPYALIMSLDPERLVELLQTPELPDGWFAAVADRKNINMARSHLSERFIGQPVPGEWLRQYGERAEGVITTTDFEGQRSLQAFHWSKVTGWWIAAWAPHLGSRGAVAAGLEHLPVCRRGPARPVAPAGARHRPPYVGADRRADDGPGAALGARQARSAAVDRTARGRRAVAGAGQRGQGAAGEDRGAGDVWPPSCPPRPTP